MPPINSRQLFFLKRIKNPSSVLIQPSCSKYLKVELDPALMNLVACWCDDDKDRIFNMQWFSACSTRVTFHPQRINLHKCQSHLDSEKSIKSEISSSFFVLHHNGIWLFVIDFDCFLKSFILTYWWWMMILKNLNHLSSKTESWIYLFNILQFSQCFFLWAWMHSTSKYWILELFYSQSTALTRRKEWQISKQ